MPRGSLSDRYPQLLTAYVVQAAANVYAETLIPLPVPRYGGSANRPYVFEILKVFVTPEWTIQSAATGNIDVQIATVSLGAIDFADPRVFIREAVLEAFTTSGATINHNSFMVDFTVGDRGLLIGTDNLYLGINTGVITGVARAYVSFLYRLITVNASEYIGIVQSQQ